MKATSGRWVLLILTVVVCAMLAGQLTVVWGNLGAAIGLAVLAVLLILT